MTVPFGAMDRIGVLKSLYPSPIVTQPDVTKVERKLSPLEKAQKEMLANGITSEQRQGYVPRVSESLAYHVNPSGYMGHEEDIKKAILHAIMPVPIPDVNKYAGKIATPGRIDAWRMYLGLPQQNGTFGVSIFQPSKGAEDKVYFKINNFVNLLEKIPIISKRNAFATIVDMVKGNKGKTAERDDWAGVMGQYKFELGKDSRGNYLSYYDNWDLDPGDPNRVQAFGGGSPTMEQKAAGVAAKHLGKPFEIYDRIYYDPKTLKPIPESKLQSATTLEEVLNAKRRK
jgi:hypothetical protein